jgi:hypothetical protein
MGEHPQPEGLTEAEVALFALVAALEGDDFRNPTGVPATTTPAFVDARTLVWLLVLLGRTRSSRR